MRVYENMVLRRILGLKREELEGDWRRFHNEELHNLYASQSIINEIKTRKIRWAGYVARVGEMRNS
jgi:hypothetical protein